MSRRGDVYVVGAVSGTISLTDGWGGGKDAFAVRLDQAGNFRWLHQSAEIGDDVNYSAATTPQSELVTAGYTSAASPGDVIGFKSGQGAEDGFVAKYSRSGTRLWANDHGTADGEIDMSVVVAKNGHIYVAGATEGSWPGFTQMGKIGRAHV